ncbi:MAG: hypothetical protein ABI577_03415 [bacterium]
MPDQVVVGATVVTNDAKEIGRVKEVGDSAFLVDAPRQFDYWLELTLMKAATADRVELAIAESELSSYKMDRPNDHNGFREDVPNALKPGTVRDGMLRGPRPGL